MNTNQQLELGFRGTPSRQLGKGSPARIARGQWWFARMREAVGSAMEWQSDSNVREEPMFLSRHPEKSNA
jgi:hypothetical protein